MSTDYLPLLLLLLSAQHSTTEENDGWLVIENACVDGHQYGSTCITDALLNDCFSACVSDCRSFEYSSINNNGTCCLTTANTESDGFQNPCNIHQQQGWTYYEKPSINTQTPNDSPLSETSLPNADVTTLQRDDISDLHGVCDVAINGRTGESDVINGVYIVLGEYNSSPYYWEGNDQLFLYYHEENGRWYISPELGSTTAYAKAEDTSGTADEIENDWFVSDYTNWVIDSDVEVECYDFDDCPTEKLCVRGDMLSSIENVFCCADNEECVFRNLALPEEGTRCALINDDEESPANDPPSSNQDDQPICRDDPHWVSLYGLCESYYPDESIAQANFNYCLEDIGVDGRLASIACPVACEQCENTEESEE